MVLVALILHLYCLLHGHLPHLSHNGHGVFSEGARQGRHYHVRAVRDEVHIELEL